jgi:hypothetical protein
MKEEDRLENPDIGGRIILKCILQKSFRRTLTGFTWNRTGTKAICCECGDESSSSIKCGEFLY